MRTNPWGNHIPSFDPLTYELTAELLASSGGPDTDEANFAPLPEESERTWRRKNFKKGKTIMDRRFA